MIKIDKNNILIAQFMGYELTTDEFKMLWCGVPSIERLNKINDNYIPILINNSSDKKEDILFKDSMEYNSSWEWLMPVIHKAFNVTSEIDKRLYDLKLFKLNLNTSIHDAYEALIEFINWQNTQIGIFNILLDLDGVMVTTPSWQQTKNMTDGFPDFNPKTVECLNKILEHTKGKIVLTSSHKSRYNHNQWLNIFKKRGVKLKYFDKLPPNILGLSKKEEILNWINYNPEEEYVIIDDDKTLNEMNDFVLTSSLIGLGENEMQNVINLYNINHGIHNRRNKKIS